jgi:hypothetical protein
MPPLQKSVALMKDFLQLPRDALDFTPYGTGSSQNVRGITRFVPPDANS